LTPLSRGDIFTKPKKPFAMEEKTVLQPVGCAPKQSFVLQKLKD
jgi:hypothetical protein